MENEYPVKYQIGGEIHLEDLQTMNCFSVPVLSGGLLVKRAIKNYKEKGEK
jgi:hypothetical protein